MALPLSELLTKQANDLKAGNTANYKSTRRKEFAQQAHRAKYRPNPLNYALSHTYKLFVLFNDGTVCNLIAPVIQTTYAQYKYQGFIKADFVAALEDFNTRIKVKYYGQYKTAIIYSIVNGQSTPIIQYNAGVEMPTEWDGILHDSAKIVPAELERWCKYFNIPL